jgi:hypothetical protein
MTNAALEPVVANTRSEGTRSRCCLAYMAAMAARSAGTPASQV